MARSSTGIMWGLGGAVSLAAYFLLSGVLHVTASAGDVELLHRHVSWIVPTLGLALVSAVIAYVAGIAAVRRLGARLASFTGIAEVLFAVLYAWLLLGQPPNSGTDRLLPGHGAKGYCST